nr:MAG TPA: hypothetical protein [Caudoviricetes sp.]
MKEVIKCCTIVPKMKPTTSPCIWERGGTADDIIYEILV